MTRFPQIKRTADSVGPDDRITAIEYVNRVNWLFETYDLEGMISAFLPDANVFHFHGTLRGETDIRRFLTDDYPYLVPGVSRHASNHIVDSDSDGGVYVRYQNLLVRFASPEMSAKLGAGEVIDSNEGLPAVWLYSPMLDRLSKTPEGWKIRERHVGGSTTNIALAPADMSAQAMRQFLPR